MQVACQGDENEIFQALVKRPPDHPWGADAPAGGMLAEEYCGGVGRGRPTPARAALDYPRGPRRADPLSVKRPWSLAELAAPGPILPAHRLPRYRSRGSALRPGRVAAHRGHQGQGAAPAGST